MLLFSGSDLSLSFGERDVFKGLNFEVKVGEKVALVGTNGVGKTSLLRIISGRLAPASGAVAFYLPVQSAFLNEEFDASPELTAAQVLRNTVERDRLNDRVGEALKKFGFAQTRERRVGSFSGGEKTRLQLACVWLKNPELLLLDEPTNHLDNLHLDWLEGFIRDYRGAVVLVSHDRYFLDRTVARVLELTPAGITSYPGNYSDYARTKRLRYEQEFKTYHDQERRARKLRRAVAELSGWGEKGHRESRCKARDEGPTMGRKEYFRAKAKKLDRRVKNNVKRLNRMLEEQITQPKPGGTRIIWSGNPKIPMAGPSGNTPKKCVWNIERLNCWENCLRWTGTSSPKNTRRWRRNIWRWCGGYGRSKRVNPTGFKLLSKLPPSSRRGGGLFSRSPTPIRSAFPPYPPL
jgi:macrolide transport system ATP-binding/permease protein